MSVCVTVFLTFVLSLSIMLNVLPNSSLQISVHVTYLATLSACSALFVMLSLFVLSLYHRHGTVQPVGAGWAAFVTSVRRYRQCDLAIAALSAFCRAPERSPDRKGPVPEEDVDIPRLQTLTTSVQERRDALPCLPTYASAVDGDELKTRTNPSNSGSVVYASDAADQPISCWELKTGCVDDSQVDDDITVTNRSTQAAGLNDKESDGNGVKIFLSCDLCDPLPPCTLGDNDDKTDLDDSQREASQQMAEQTENAAETTDQMADTQDIVHTENLKAVRQIQVVQKTDQTKVVQKMNQLQAVQKTGRVQTGKMADQTENAMSVTQTDVVQKSGQVGDAQHVSGMDAVQETEKHLARKKNREGAGDSISWRDVAECLDYVMFRFFLCFVVVATVTATALMTVQYSDVSHEW